MLLHVTAVTRTDVDIRPLIPAEQEALRALKEAGVVRESFIRTDHAGAYFIVEAESVEAAQQHFATLPFVQEGIMTTEYAELIPAS